MPRKPTLKQEKLAKVTVDMINSGEVLTKGKTFLQRLLINLE